MKPLGPTSVYQKMKNKEPKKDKCVSCGVETQYDEFDHIDFRNFYIEGAGQLCVKCFNDIYKPKSDDLSDDMRNASL